MTICSLIVPTRNRCDTLDFTLQTAVAINDDRLEIIVSDNASDDATQEIVSAYPDSRIRYVNTGQRLGMSQNWEFALSHARGDWIGYIGDDDGILPDAIERLREIVADTGVEAVRARNAQYIWPALAEQARGVLAVPMGGKVTVRDSRRAIHRVLHGIDHYSTLPMLYHGGFAARTLIDRARGQTGPFFRSRIPDVYSGILLGHIAGKFAWSERPLAINGASAHSTGTSQFTTSKNPGNVSPSSMFLSEDNIPFHEAIPLNRDGTIPKSLQILVFESWHQIRDLYPDIEEIDAMAQLKAINQSAGRYTEILGWLDDFATKNGLDPAVVAGVFKGERLRHFTWLSRRVWDGDWHSDFAPTETIANVADATRLAARVLASETKTATLPARNFVRKARRLGQRLTAKATT